MKTWLSGAVSERLKSGGGAETGHELEVEIEQIRARLAANEAERKELEAALRDLVSRCSATACGECPHQAFLPVTDDIIEKHLRGEGAHGIVLMRVPMR